MKSPSGNKEDRRGTALKISGKEVTQKREAEVSSNIVHVSVVCFAKIYTTETWLHFTLDLNCCFCLLLSNCCVDKMESRRYQISYQKIRLLWSVLSLLSCLSPLLHLISCHCNRILLSLTSLSWMNQEEINNKKNGTKGRARKHKQPPVIQFWRS